MTPVNTVEENHIHDEDKCFNIVEILQKKSSSDAGFSGVTHAMTGVVAVELIFISALIFGWGNVWLNFAAIPMIAGFALAAIGATLVPDLDNTRSTSHSALGPVGLILSYIFRGSSVFMQTVVRSPKDDPTPNPHRGFWHTLLSALLLGFGTYALSFIPLAVNLPVFGEVELGTIIACLIFCMMIHLFFAALAKPMVKKLKSAPLIGDLIAFLFSAALGIVIFIFIPQDGFLWLGVGIAVGCSIHILGDTFTKYGTPLFFPLSIFTKGRFWWYTRFAAVKSGGDFETKVIIKGLYIASVILAIVFVVLLIL